jgi:hypothetical protein
VHAALVGEVGRVAHDDRVDQADLEIERCAQRPGRNDLAIADAALPSTRAIDKSFVTLPFCRPSSMMTTLNGRRSPSMAIIPARRSRATIVGATAASSSGSSPKRLAAPGVSSTQDGPDVVPP